jgi:hypothetical protein
MVERHAAKAQGHTGLEFVRVVAKSDACVHHPRGSPMFFRHSGRDPAA